MSRRYAITQGPEALRAFFGYREQPAFPPRYNVAPTQPIPIVTRDERRLGVSDRHFRLVRWGFVPSFVKDFGAYPLIVNARAEGLEDKPSFRAAMIRRRCLVIADGYYEWRKLDPKRPGTPYLIRRTDGRPIGFAGLWECWMGADGSELDTGCIVTTAANGALAAIHPRMPAIIEATNFERWLDVETVGPAAAARLLVPAAEDILSPVEIGTAVNTVANDGAGLQQPVGPAPAAVGPEGQLRLL